MKVYTIGHSNRDLYVFINILIHYGITHLIDIRSVPYSRFEQFDQGNLQRQLKACNIEYVYMGDTLGGRPDDPACYNNGVVAIEDINYRMYENTDGYRRAIQNFMRACMAPNKVVCIMCTEKIPSICHRHNLITKTLQESQFEVIHIIDETFTTRETTYRDGLIDNRTGEEREKSRAPRNKQISMFE